MIYLNNYYLRPLEITDLGWAKKLRSDKDTWPYLENFSLINDSRQRKWFEVVSSDSSKEHLIFGSGDERLGLVKLTDIDRINRSMGVGGDIIPDKRNQGYGAKMYLLIFKLGFGEWGMHRLWLTVLASNKGAIALYKKLGFIEEGRARQAVFRGGQFVDCVIMSLLSDEYFNRSRA